MTVAYCAVAAPLSMVGAALYQRNALGGRIGGLEAKFNYVMGGIGVVIALAIPVVVYVVQDWLSR